MTAFANPFELPGQWYKGNLHCHTTRSDGAYSPQELVDVYASLGYAFAAFTDHRTVTEVQGLNSRGLLLMQGIELDGNYPDRDMGYHIVAIDVSKEIEKRFDPAALAKSVWPQQILDLAHEEAAFSIVAHPYWCGQSVIELLELHGYDAIEIVNSVCEFDAGKGTCSAIWDALMERGRFVPAVGTDDSHWSGQQHRGHTVVKAAALAKDAVLQALKQGACYASTGAEIHDFRRQDRTFTVTCSPARKITFCTNRGFGRSFNADEGKTLTHAEYTARDYAALGMPHHQTLYVRVEIVGENPLERAWSNPILL